MSMEDEEAGMDDLRVKGEGRNLPFGIIRSMIDSSRDGYTGRKKEEQGKTE